MLQRKGRKQELSQYHFFFFGISFQYVAYEYIKKTLFKSFFFFLSETKPSHFYRKRITPFQLM